MTPVSNRGINPEIRDLAANDDLDALRLFVQTARENSLPDSYEAKVTVGFMVGLWEHIQELKANSGI